MQGSETRLEIRAERIRTGTARDLRRSGGTDLRRAAQAFREAGERIRIRTSGPATETVGGDATLEAGSIERTVRGRATVRRRLDNTIVGGTLTETRTGAELSLAGMRDEIVLGAGFGVSSPLAVTVAGLNACEDRPASTGADQVLVELTRLAIEREYGTALHHAGVAVFSGTVCSTQATSLRPLLRCYRGVRNLSAGSGSPPAPAAAPAGGAPGPGLLDEGAPAARGTVPSAGDADPPRELYASTPGRASDLDEARRLGDPEASSLRLDPNETILAGDAPLPSPPRTYEETMFPRDSIFDASDLVGDGLPSYPDSGLHGTPSDVAPASSPGTIARSAAPPPPRPPVGGEPRSEPFERQPRAHTEFLRPPDGELAARQGAVPLPEPEPDAHAPRPPAPIPFEAPRGRAPPTAAPDPDPGHPTPSPE